MYHFSPPSASLNPPSDELSLPRRCCGDTLCWKPFPEEVGGEREATVVEFEAAATEREWCDRFAWTLPVLVEVLLFAGLVVLPAVVVVAAVVVVFWACEAAVARERVWLATRLLNDEGEELDVDALPEEGCGLERAEWARKPARKLAKNGRLVGVGMIAWCDWRTCVLLKCM